MFEFVTSDTLLVQLLPHTYRLSLIGYERLTQPLRQSNVERMNYNHLL
jgi:hypothetical protein